jgi:hypothetical protein
LTKTAVLVPLDDELIAKVGRFQNGRPLPDVLTDMILYATRCIEFAAAHPQAMRILESQRKGDPP